MKSSKPHSNRWIRPYQVHTFAPMAALYGVSVLLLAATNTYSLMMACAIPIGYCNGVFMSLMPFIASKLVGVKDSPKAIGMMYFGVGISLLVVPPFSGMLIFRTRVKILFVTRVKNVFVTRMKLESSKNTLPQAVFRKTDKERVF